ncbi:MAG: acyl-homoserine-lactone synthase [Pseudomonadota bacterium]
MVLHSRIAPRREFSPRELAEMHTLRAKVFKDRLGWEVPVVAGMEIDGYDALDPLYMLIREPGADRLRGCWRLLPTEGPYMLKHSFPQLLHGQAAPAHSRIWELSRFAIETGGGAGYGFSDVALDSIADIIRYGQHAGLERYVTVTTTAIERLLRRAGVVTARFGPPLAVGVETAVALSIDIGATYQTLFAKRLAS